MRIRSTLALAVVLGLGASQQSAAQSLSPPLAANSYINVGALDWAWASPCNMAGGGCQGSFVFVDGFRFATVLEWASRPSETAFLDAGGNFAGGGGQMRCASAYFNINPAYTHCDYTDAVNGYISSGPGNDGSQGFNGNSETWLVRDAATVAPEPATFVLLGSGLALVGLAGKLRRRKKD